MNPDKCNFSLSSNDKIRKQNLTERLSTIHKSKNLLVFMLNYKLKFDTQIETLCKMVIKELHDLARVIKYMTAIQAHILMTSFIMSQFSYCSLIWICHS